MNKRQLIWMARQVPKTGQWTPLALGTSLAAWWSADDHGTANMTDDGAGLISSWKDKVGAMDATAVTTARPTWAATSFNSAYAGLTFDGVANCLVSTTLTTLPTGATAGDMYVVCSPVTSATTLVLAQYGGTTASTTRRIHKASTDNAAVMDTTVTGRNNIVTLGPHIIEGTWAGIVQDGYVDGAHMDVNAPAVIATLATGTTRLRLGANNGTSAAAFFAGVLRHIFITTTLTLVQRQRLEGWMAWDGGIPSNLPANHPYRFGRP